MEKAIEEHGHGEVDAHPDDAEQQRQRRQAADGPAAADGGTGQTALFSALPPGRAAEVRLRGAVAPAALGPPGALDVLGPLAIAGAAPICGVGGRVLTGPLASLLALTAALVLVIGPPRRLLGKLDAVVRISRAVVFERHIAA